MQTRVLLQPPRDHRAEGLRSGDVVVEFGVQQHHHVLRPGEEPRRDTATAEFPYGHADLVDDGDAVRLGALAGRDPYLGGVHTGVEHRLRLLGQHGPDLPRRPLAPLGQPCPAGGRGVVVGAVPDPVDQGQRLDRRRLPRQGVDVPLVGAAVAGLREELLEGVTERLHVPARPVERPLHRGRTLVEERAQFGRGRHLPGQRPQPGRRGGGVDVAETADQVEHGAGAVHARAQRAEDRRPDGRGQRRLDVPLEGRLHLVQQRPYVRHQFGVGQPRQVGSRAAQGAQPFPVGVGLREACLAEHPLERRARLGGQLLVLVVRVRQVHRRVGALSDEGRVDLVRRLSHTDAEQPHVGQVQVEVAAEHADERRPGAGHLLLAVDAEPDEAATPAVQAPPPDQGPAQRAGGVRQSLARVGPGVVRQPLTALPVRDPALHDRGLPLSVPAPTTALFRRRR